MKVLYDSDVFSNQTFGGISHYFIELMNHLPPQWDYDFSIYASENEYIRDLIRKKSVVPLRNFPDHRKLYHFINGFADRRALKKGKYDIFHPTGVIPYFFDIVKSPFVITIHDMTHHLLMDRTKPNKIADFIDKITLKADRIIAISQATKNDILKFYDIDEDRIDVVHHGYNPVIGDTDPLPGLPRNYILFVGHRGGYKNFDMLLQAFASVAKQDPEIALVCTGKPFSKGEVEKIKSLRLENRVFSRFIAQKDMNALYANARCFVFPSKLEGFGMPILEAFAAKCPVALSNASCLPEIAGNGALYFNPDDPANIADSIEKIIYNNNTAQSLIAAGMLQLQNYSWGKTAQLTAQTYLKALG